MQVLNFDKMANLGWKGGWGEERKAWEEDRTPGLYMERPVRRARRKTRLLHGNFTMPWGSACGTSNRVARFRGSRGSLLEVTLLGIRGGGAMESRNRVRTVRRSEEQLAVNTGVDQLGAGGFAERSSLVGEATLATFGVPGLSRCRQLTCGREQKFFFCTVPSASCPTD